MPVGATLRRSALVMPWPLSVSDFFPALILSSSRLFGDSSFGDRSTAKIHAALSVYRDLVIHRIPPSEQERRFLVKHAVTEPAIPNNR
jgi:hypothetical protein